MIIYLARNVKNGKSYVGKTKRTLDQRKNEHIRFASNGAKQPLYYAIRKHGIEAFEWSVLIDVDCTHDELNVLECKFIKQFSSFGGAGYNATLGGDGVTGWSPSPDHREKIRQAHLGEKNHNFGVSWGRTGPLVEETKQKISEANLGRKHTVEAREKISNALTQRIRKTRPVTQSSMDGDVIATYPSMKLAARAVSGQKDRIGDCCRGYRKFHAGFTWAYTEQKGSW